MKTETRGMYKYSLSHLSVIGCPPPEMTYINRLPQMPLSIELPHAARCIESAKRYFAEHPRS